MAAQVSGPGALSRRTDTGGQPIRDLPDPDYGEATAYREQQKAAPLSDSGDTRPAPPVAPSGAPQPQVEPTVPTPEPLPGLFDRGDPNIPLTAGAPIGPGPNELPGVTAPTTPFSAAQELAQYAAGDDSGAVAWLVNTLARQGL